MSEYKKIMSKKNNQNGSFFRHRYAKLKNSSFEQLTGTFSFAALL